MSVDNEIVRVLWATDLAKRYNKDRTTIWRWMQGGQLPEPDVYIGGRRGRPGWYEATILSHEVASRRAAGATPIRSTAAT